jgi:hypothetical protein
MESLDKEVELAEPDDSDSVDDDEDEQVENGAEVTFQDVEDQYEVDVEAAEVQDTVDGKVQEGSDEIPPEQDRPDSVHVEDREWVLRFLSRI